MSEALFSPYWYRVQGLRPALRAHVQIHRHHYRGDLWYVLEDRATRRHHRFSPTAWAVIGLLDGQRSLHEVFELAARHLGDDAPTQDQVIQLVAQLHAADALRADVSPDAGEVFERFAQHQRATWLAWLQNPLGMRFSLWDPDAFLERGLPWVRPLFTPIGFALWVAIVALGAFTALLHWEELSAPGLGSILDPANLVVLLLAYPAIKALHELGHAFATKVWGGEVREVGVMLLLFVPVPYVDASAAWAFGDKRRRMLVGAAGIMVELVLATLALGLWLATAPGWLHSLAWNTLLVGGISTVLFNGNPLLRYDGYYVLADALEIPNLAARATQFLGYLFQRYVLGLPERRPQVPAPGERTWLAVYGSAAFVYRVCLSFAIALLIAQRFFAIGVGLAIWNLAMQIALPAARSLGRLRADPRVSQNPARVAAGAGSLALGALLLLFVPVPVWTVAEGVVWLPEGAQVRAGADGFVRRVLAQPGSQVGAGQPLLELDDPLLRARLRVLEARERELVARVHGERTLGWAESDIRGEELRSLQAELARERERAHERIVRSASAGTLTLPLAQNLPGRFVQRGEVLGYITGFDQTTVRTVVPQWRIARVRGSTRRVSVRPLQHPGQEILARVTGEVPSASSKLPSLALGAAGGGTVAVDLRDQEGLTAVESFFQVDLALAPGGELDTIGSRVWVRFDHAPARLAPLLFDSVRRMFLGKLGV